MKYPLDAVEVVRDLALDEAERRLASTISAREAAGSARERAASALAELRRLEGARIAREEARLSAGCTAAELQRAEDYRRARRSDDALAAAALMKAHAEERRAIERVEEARRAVSRAGADAEALARHRGRWEAERERDAERRRDDELDDLANRSR